MPSENQKSINILLNDGTLKGVICLEDSKWNKGELFAAPRSSVEHLMKEDACSRFGVYLLLSNQQVYIGQASDLAKRIKQHKAGKLWWERVVLLTTSDDSFTKSDIDFLEAALIKKADEIGRLDCENKNKGNKPKVSKFQKVVLLQYLDEALFLLELIGVNVFAAKTKRDIGALNGGGTVLKGNNGEIRIETKKEGIRLFADRGVSVGENVTFSTLKGKKSVFRANPERSFLKSDWFFILNYRDERELVLLRIPKGTFRVGNEKGKQLPIRKDKPNQLALAIDSETLVDKRSKCDFSPFKVTSEKYG